MANRLKLLSLDTSTHACTAALLIQSPDGQLTTIARHQVAPMQHTQLLLPMIHELLTEAGLTLASLDAIAVGVGPGSLTGCRLAVSVAQGLGLAHGLPLVPISTLAAIAQARFLSHGDRDVLVSVDARAGHVYLGAYHVTEAGLAECVVPDQWVTPADAAWPLDRAWVQVGDGFGLEAAYPTGVALSLLGIQRFKAEGGLPPSALEPAYLHDW